MYYVVTGDKSLWAIDPKDRMPALGRKKTSVM